jgi:hypothetical protein
VTPLDTIGTPAQRWAAAELDVMLGRVTPRELWELGREIIAGVQQEVGDKLGEVQSERDDLQDERDDLQRELETLKAGAKK